MTASRIPSSSTAPRTAATPAPSPTQTKPTPVAAKAPSTIDGRSSYSTGRDLALRDFATTGALPSNAQPTKGTPGATAGAVGPVAQPKPTSSTASVQSAVEQLKGAQATQQTAGTSLSRQEHADLEVATARTKLKEAIDTSGIPLNQVNARFAQTSSSPADRLMVAEAAADLGKDKADAVAAKYGLQNDPNLEGRAPGGAHLAAADASRVSQQSADDTTKARLLEGQLQDQLLQTADRSVADLRGQGLSREQALGQLQKGAGATAAEVLGEKSGVPNTLGMTQQEKGAVYLSRFQATASPEAKTAYERGERVVLGLRHDTPLSENDGKGVYDDRFVVLQKGSAGDVGLVKEYRACLDPNTKYGDSMRDTFDTKSDAAVGPYATAHADNPLNPFDSNTVDAYGRITSGQTIRFQTGPDSTLYPPPDGGYQVQGDANGDGAWNDSATRSAKGNQYQLHHGATGHTGSGGCLTVPPSQWADFRSTILDGQPTVSSGHLWKSSQEQAVYVTLA